MKLIRFGRPGQEKPGILHGEQRFDVSAFGEDYHEAFFANDGLRRLADFVRAHAGDLPPVAATERLGPPVARPSKILCVGLNYADHAREIGAKPPPEPVLAARCAGANRGRRRAFPGRPEGFRCAPDADGRS